MEKRLFQSQRLGRVGAHIQQVEHGNWRANPLVGRFQAYEDRGAIKFIGQRAHHRLFLAKRRLHLHRIAHLHPQRLRQRRGEQDAIVAQGFRGGHTIFQLPLVHLLVGRQGIQKHIFTLAICPKRHRQHQARRRRFHTLPALHLLQRGLGLRTVKHRHQIPSLHLLEGAVEKVVHGIQHAPGKEHQHESKDDGKAGAQGTAARPKDIPQRQPHGQRGRRGQQAFQQAAAAAGERLGGVEPHSLGRMHVGAVPRRPPCCQRRHDQADAQPNHHQVRVNSRLHQRNAQFVGVSAGNATRREGAQPCACHSPHRANNQRQGHIVPHYRPVAITQRFHQTNLSALGTHQPPQHDVKRKRCYQQN